MPNPYAILIAAGASLGLIIGAFFFGENVKDTTWQARWNKFQADQFALQADATEKARKAEAANAATTAALGEIKHDADIKISDADARVRAALAAARLRQRNACAGGHDMRGTETAGGSADAARGGQDSMAGQIDEYLAACSRGADELAAYAHMCQSWAVRLPHAVLP